MGKQDAPAIPSPAATAQAQTTSNIDTAVAQKNLNATDTKTPFGNLTYSVTGTNSDGTPKYTATAALSPELQSAFDRANTSISAPLDLSSSGLDKFTNTHFADDFNQQNDRNRAALETRLSEQGIVQGSEAYRRAMEDFGVTSGKSFDNFLGDQQANAKDLMLTGRNQPLNEFASLTGLGQQINTPQTGVAGTDVAGIQQNAYNARVNQVNQSNQQTNSVLGGLFGLGSSALMAFSDERLKEDITPTGETVAGVPVKEWTWKGTGERDSGVIAQELERKHPELVDNSHPSGFKRVDYGGLAIADAVRKYRKAA